MHVFQKEQRKQPRPKLKAMKQPLMLKRGGGVHKDFIQGYGFRRREAEFLQVKIQTHLNPVMQLLLYLKSDEVEVKLQANLAELFQHSAHQLIRSCVSESDKL